MRIASVITPFDDLQMRRMAQVGVEAVVVRYPAWHGRSLAELQRHAGDHGLRVAAVEGYLPHDAIVHGDVERRPAQLEAIQSLLQNMGELGVPILCYNFMPDDDWNRTSATTPERAGARVTAFDAEELDKSWQPASGAIESEQSWDHLAWFLERVVPVAESAGVRLALHPDDPPIPHLRGQDRSLSRPESFDRLFTLNPNPHNAMCFCQGTFASMGDLDLPATIRRFGDRIAYVHFRDVVGAVPSFRETFHDNGKTDMAACIRAYRDINFTGFMRPDHVPTLAGESNDTPGYHMLGRLHAVGYMRGLIDATDAIDAIAEPEDG